MAVEKPRENSQAAANGRQEDAKGKWREGGRAEGRKGGALRFFK